MKLLSSCALLATAACAGQAAFRPSEAEGQASGNNVGAYYEVAVDNRNFGDVKVASTGAREADEGPPFVELVLRVRNDGAEPLQLDLAATGVEMIVDDRLVVVDAELAMDGSAIVPPGGLERLIVRYALPADTAPRDLSAFDFFWRIATPAGPFTQSTPFERVVQRSGTAVIYQPALFWGWGPGFGHPGRPWPP